MEFLIYIVVFIVLATLPEMLSKSKKKQKYEYPDFDDMKGKTKVPGQIIIKKEDELGTPEEVYLDLEDFFKKKYEPKIEVQEPVLTDTQKKYKEYVEQDSKKKQLKENSVIPQAIVNENKVYSNDIVRGIVFSEIIMKPRAYRPFRGPNT